MASPRVHKWGWGGCTSLGATLITITQIGTRMRPVCNGSRRARIVYKLLHFSTCGRTYQSDRSLFLQQPKGIESCPRSRWWNLGTNKTSPVVFLGRSSQPSASHNAQLLRVFSMRCSTPPQRCGLLRNLCLCSLLKLGPSSPDAGGRGQRASRAASRGASQSLLHDARGRRCLLRAYRSFQLQFFYV
jgi:hypothetical protein